MKIEFFKDLDVFFDNLLEYFKNCDCKIPMDLVEDVVVFQMSVKTHICVNEVKDTLRRVIDES